MHAEEDRTSTGTLYCVAWRAFAPQLPCTPADRASGYGPASILRGGSWRRLRQHIGRPGEACKAAGLGCQALFHMRSTSGCLAFLRKLQVPTRLLRMCLTGDARILKVSRTAKPVLTGSNGHMVY